MLFAIDGNDSLKRILRRMFNPDTGERDGSSRERADSRSVPEGIYIPREDVDKWAMTVVQESMGVTEEVCLCP
jgi:hypothetical protein